MRKIEHLTFQFEGDANEEVFSFLIGLSTVQVVWFINLVGFALGQAVASVSWSRVLHRISHRNRPRQLVNSITWVPASNFTAPPLVLPMKNQALPARRNFSQSKLLFLLVERQQSQRLLLAMHHLQIGHLQAATMQGFHLHYLPEDQLKHLHYLVACP